MRDLGRRLDRLELGTERVVPASGLAKEIREIDQHIRCLDREIEEMEAALSPGEVAESRRAHDMYMQTLQGLSLGEKIACLDREIQGIRG